MRGAADALAKSSGTRICWSATSPRKARSPARACSSTSSTPCCISRATRIRAFRLVRAIKNRFGAVNETRRVRDDRARPEGRLQPVGAVPVAARRRGAGSCVLVTLRKARGRCWWRSRRWSTRRTRRIRGGSRSASSRTGWPCCWRCCTAMPASPRSTRTCSSTRSAACASTSRRRTWRCCWRSCPHCGQQRRGGDHHAATADPEQFQLRGRHTGCRGIATARS
jgi:hypothetical protein